MSAERLSYATLEDRERLYGKKSILILGFGGTIAMVPDVQRGLRPAKNVKDILDQVPTINEMARINFKQLENIDSTNVNPLHWKKLAGEIKRSLDEEMYNGIIVTHGTDTMAYTASAVALALGRGLQQPVVFTGSQLPLVEHGTDARFNLENAVKTVIKASDEHVAEVMITFSDKVLRGARAIKTSESRFPAFDSPAIEQLADITAMGVQFHSHALRADDAIPMDFKGKFHRFILTIDLVPGLNPSYIQYLIRNTRLDGILLKSLGAGNVPTIGNGSLIPTIREAVGRNIPVVVTTKFVGGRTNMNIYETGKKALEAGAVSAGDMTDVMAQVKFMWVLAQQDPREPLKGFKEKMQTNYVGEITS